MNRLLAQYATGIALIVVGFFFGFVALSPCGGNGCAFDGAVVGWEESYLLSLGPMILGIAILVVSISMRFRSPTAKGRGRAT